MTQVINYTILICFACLDLMTRPHTSSYAPNPHFVGSLPAPHFPLSKLTTDPGTYFIAQGSYSRCPPQFQTPCLLSEAGKATSHCLSHPDPSFFLKTFDPICKVQLKDHLLQEAHQDCLHSTAAPLAHIFRTPVAWGTDLVNQWSQFPC